MLFSVFENVLDAHLSSSRQIVLALSGGIDSRVLLDLLYLQGRSPAAPLFSHPYPSRA